MSKRATKRKGEAHVRLYRHELECAAYRSLSTDARALLVEFRALYTGQENRVFFAVRDMMASLGVAQRRAQAARDELLDRGFIRMLSPGAFTRKVRHAAEYALLSECIGNEHKAEKPYMAWRPPAPNGDASKKTRYAGRLPTGSRGDYLKGSEKGKKARLGSRSEYLNGSKPPHSGSQDDYTDISARHCLNFLEAALACETGSRGRAAFLILLLAAHWPTELEVAA